MYANYAQKRKIFVPKNFANVPNEVKNENILTAEFVYTISQQHSWSLARAINANSMR